MTKTTRRYLRNAAVFIGTWVMGDAAFAIFADRPFLSSFQFDLAALPFFGGAVLGVIFSWWLATEREKAANG